MLDTTNITGMLMCIVGGLGVIASVVAGNIWLAREYPRTYLLLCFILGCLLLLVGGSLARAAPAELGTGELPYGLHLLELREVVLDGYQIQNNRDEYFPYQDPGAREPGEHWTKGLALDLHLNLVRLDPVSLYAQMRPHGEFTNVQARQVGLQYELGLRYQDYLDLYWYHDSEHALDQSKDASGATRPAWPLRNFIGCRIVLYKTGR